MFMKYNQVENMGKLANWTETQFDWTAIIGPSEISDAKINK